jgi:hypothetical protein
VHHVFFIRAAISFVIRRGNSGNKKKYSARNEYGVMYEENEERGSESTRKTCEVKRSRRMGRKGEEEQRQGELWDNCVLWRKTVVTDFRLLVGIPGLGLDLDLDLDLLFPLFSRGKGRNCGAFQPGQSAPSTGRGHAVQY